jgi:hypothetical protein
MGSRASWVHGFKSELGSRASWVQERVGFKSELGSRASWVQERVGFMGSRASWVQERVGFMGSRASWVQERVGFKSELGSRANWVHGFKSELGSWVQELVINISRLTLNNNCSRALRGKGREEALGHEGWATPFTAVTAHAVTYSDRPIREPRARQGSGSRVISVALGRLGAGRENPILYSLQAKHIHERSGRTGGGLEVWFMEFSPHMVFGGPCQ